MVIAAAILLAAAEISQAIYKTQDKNWEPNTQDRFWKFIFSRVIVGGLVLHIAKPIVYLFNN